MAEREVSVKLTASTQAYEQAMRRAGAATKGFGADAEQAATKANAGFTKLGGDMQSVGRTMSVGVTAPIVAAGGAAVKMSLDFDGAFTKMQTLAGVTAGEVDGMKESVLKLAGSTARSPQELAEAMYFLRSSGLDAGEAMSALQASAKASAAGLGSTAVLADAVSSAMNAYAKSGLGAADATDILIATARAGKAEPAELASSLGRVLPVAAQLGVSFEDVGGAIATFSQTGNSASESTTLLTNVLSKLLKPSQQGAEMLEKVGMSADTIKQSIADKGLLATLEDLRNRLGESGYVKFLEDQQAVVGGLALVGDAASGAADTFAQVADNVGLTNEAFDTAAGSDGFKMKQAWSDIQTAMIRAGDVILPIVLNIAEGVAGLANIFADLPEPVKKIVVGFLAFAAAAGPLLVIGGSLVKNFQLIKGALTGLQGGLAGAGAALPVIGVAIAGIGAHAASNAEHVGKLGEALSTLATAPGTDMKDAVAQVVVHAAMLGQLDTVWQDLAETNREAAVRVRDWSVATGQAAGLTDALNAALASTEPTFVSVGGAASGAALLVGDAKDHIVALTTATDGGRAAGDQYVEMLQAHGRSVDRSAVEERILAGRVEASEKAIKNTTDALKDQIDSLEDHLKLLEDEIDLNRSFADSQMAASRATDEFARFLEELPDKIKEISKSEDSQAEKQRQINELYRQGADEAAAMADAAVQAYSDASNGTLTATQKVDLFNQSMLDAAGRASGPLRQSILDYVAATNEIPPDKVTQIQMYVEAGLMDEARRLLDETSESRDAAIKADAVQADLNAANKDLDQVSNPGGRPRTATIVATAQTNAAARALAGLGGRVVPEFDVGGRIPGPLGSPQLVLAHGGETVLPTHKESFASAAASWMGASFAAASQYGGSGSSSTSYDHSITAPITVVHADQNTVEGVNRALVLARMSR